jgi:hypothetical protein
MKSLQDTIAYRHGFDASEAWGEQESLTRA